MGQEIEYNQFSNHDFSTFSKHLKEETHLLGELFKNNRISNEGNIGGFEIEAWLVSQSGSPVPVNQTFLSKLNLPLVVPELAAFNVELNSEPVYLQNNALTQMEKQLQDIWKTCQIVAKDLSIEMMMIGILPNIQQKHLTMANMSQLNRYRALNEQVIKLRNGQPLKLDINGKDKIHTSHYDVMFESACTSLQLHLQVPVDKAAQFYNISIMLSAPIVAATANSPYFFGYDLWDETRIPLFEQSVELGSNDYRRVTFGSGYVRDSIFECFEENLTHYPVLVPLKEQNEIEQLSRVKFHNGTIWRWNRPLIGFDENDVPHIRIEHRVIPSGPTVTDSIANAAFYFGLVSELVDEAYVYEKQLPFVKAKENFYLCAKHGLSADIDWPNHGNKPVKHILLEELIPAAQRGLLKLNITKEDINKYLSIIEHRVESEQNGANWQRRWVIRHGADMRRLTLAYLDRQNNGDPVHKWNL